MHELLLRRRENLRQLVKARGGQKTFLEEVGYTKGWLSQLIGKTPERDLSEKIAREIEHKTGVSQGSLDSAISESTEQVGDGEVQIAKVLNQNLRNLMDERGINQTELARRAKMAITSVNRVFNALDNDVSPRLETLAGIARGLGVHASELLKTELSAPLAAPHEPPFTVARQLSRLVEDFLLSAPAERSELLRLAAEASSKSSSQQRWRGAAQTLAQTERQRPTGAQALGHTSFWHSAALALLSDSVQR
jgi:transcriptional regulator with XRE-family HTH domain